VSICPGISFGDSLLDELPESPFAGQALGAYLGRAVAPKLYANSQSGGVVSAIQASLLDEGVYGGVVTVAMAPGRKPRPQVVLAKNIADIENSQKSKYCPVPILRILKEIQNSPDPIAIVGLPCHIHGLKNLMEYYPKLRQKVGVTIGLVCDRILTYGALDYLVSKAGFDDHADTLLHFRDKTCGGYPGNIKVMSSTGGVEMPARLRTGIKDYYTPARCRLCFDKMNIFADIVCCDPHGLSTTGYSNGATVVVVRTPQGQNVVMDARDTGFLEIQTIEFENVLKGQRIDRKKAQWLGFVRAWRSMGRALPTYCDAVSEKLDIVADTNCEKLLKHALSLEEKSQNGTATHRITRKLLIKNAFFYARQPFKTIINFLRK
jgi:coenzyme F420 hydrogenase subunit beta